MKATLSIGIPAYLDHSGVQRILETLEDRADLEILISEDLPPGKDGLEDNLPNWANVRYTKNTPALGAVPNWNAVLQRATGEFIWVIHHDEAPHFPSGLNAFLDRLKETKADLMLSRLNKHTDNFLKRAVRHDTTRRVLLRFPQMILLQNYIGSPSNMIVRKSKIESFDEHLQWFVDMEWFYRQIKKAHVIDLSAFEITPFPHAQSIKNALTGKIRRISLSEVKYISKKHDIALLFYWAWCIKINLREIYFRRRDRV